MNTQEQGFNISHQARNGNNGDYTGTWKIWGEDGNYIYIISTNPTAKTLTLEGISGYNNAVTLLDNICDNVFTDHEVYPESYAQNLKLTQLTAVATGIYGNKFGADYGNANISYNLNWPKVWRDYEATNTEARLNREKAYPLVPIGKGTVGREQLRPTLTVFENNYSMDSQCWPSAYQSLLIQGTRYYIGTRYVFPATNQVCWFGIQTAYMGYVDRSYLCSYDEGKLQYHKMSWSLRPVISFPSSMYELQEQSDGTYNIVKK